MGSFLRPLREKRKSNYTRLRLRLRLRSEENGHGRRTPSNLENMILGRSGDLPQPERVPFSRYALCTMLSSKQSDRV
jgi:hypothetical protein